MEKDGGESFDEGGLEAKDVEEGDGVKGGRGPRRVLRRIGEEARRGKGRKRRRARKKVGERWVREETGARSGERSEEEAGRKGVEVWTSQR